MKQITSILVFLMAAGLARAQSPEVIQNTRSMMQTVQKNATAASNEALGTKATAKPEATVIKVHAAPVQAKAPDTTKSAPATTKPAPAKSASVKPATTAPASGKAAVKPAAQKKAAAPKSPTMTVATAPATAAPKNEVADQNNGDDDKDSPEKKWSMSGKRDPFISPVVSHAGGSGCTTGKKCLEIGAINLRGVVRSDNGFIAVVTNSLNKAYFLRENDPVFDGYVVKITGDSIVFKETLQDRLGKTFTREVVKKITTPAV
jgi:hypothetical protein